jgi:hypothetical protein
LLGEEAMIYFIAFAVYCFGVYIGYSFGKQAGLAEARLIHKRIMGGNN